MSQNLFCRIEVHVTQVIPPLSWSYNITLVLEQLASLWMDPLPEKHVERKTICPNLGIFFLIQIKFYPKYCGPVVSLVLDSHSSTFHEQ